MTRHGLSVQQRLWLHVDKNGPMPDFSDPRVRLTSGDGNCWVWDASVATVGYGQINAGQGRKMMVHRVSYESEVGSIPDGMVIDHLCRNIKCVRPNHLEPVTHVENVRRGAAQKLQTSKNHASIETEKEEN